MPRRVGARRREEKLPPPTLIETERRDDGSLRVRLAGTRLDPWTVWHWWQGYLQSWARFHADHPDLTREQVDACLAWCRDQPPPAELVIAELEMVQKEWPTRWEGCTADGKHVHIRAKFHRVTVEVDDQIVYRISLNKGHPGATDSGLSNAGLKQAAMLPGVEIVFPF